MENQNTVQGFIPVNSIGIKVNNVVGLHGVPYHNILAFTCQIL